MPALLGLHLPAHSTTSRSEHMFTQSIPQLTGSAAADSTSLLRDLLQPLHDRSRHSVEKSTASSSLGGLIHLSAKHGFQLEYDSGPTCEPLVSPILLEALNQAECSNMDDKVCAALREHYPALQSLAFEGAEGGNFILPEEVSPTKHEEGACGWSHWYIPGSPPLLLSGCSISLLWMCLIKDAWILPDCTTNRGALVSDQSLQPAIPYTSPTQPMHHPLCNYANILVIRVCNTVTHSCGPSDAAVRHYWKCLAGACCSWCCCSPGLPAGAARHLRPGRHHRQPHAGAADGHPQLLWRLAAAAQASAPR